MAPKPKTASATSPSATSPEFIGGWLLSGGRLPQRDVKRTGAVWNESLHGWVVPLTKERQARSVAKTLGLSVRNFVVSPEETKPKPDYDGPTARRFRVSMTERQHYLLDVMAMSEQEAAAIALSSSEWWVDAGGDHADVDSAQELDTGDDSFAPPRDACATCGRTLTPVEGLDTVTCDDCGEGTQRR